MAEGRLRQSHNRLDNAEDIAKFYKYNPRWVGATGPKGKRLMVLNPVYQCEREKIVAGPIPAHFNGSVRLPKGTERAIYSPIGSVSLIYPSYHQPYLVDVRNEGTADACLRITCLGYWPSAAYNIYD
jgi:hypothetical protein